MTEKAIKKIFWQMPQSLKFLQRNLVLDKILEKNSPQGAWDDIAEEMLLEFEESGFSRVKDVANCRYTSLTVFRIVISVNQVSIYGAVAAICEEFENHQDRSREPDVLMGQSICSR